MFKKEPRNILVTIFGVENLEVFLVLSTCL